MHFIEQLFGSAPDGGNGAFESLLLIFPFLIALWKMKRKPCFRLVRLNLNCRGGQACKHRAEKPTWPQ